MPFFRKPQEQPEAMLIFNAKNGTGKEHDTKEKAMEAIPFFGKPQVQPEAMLIFNVKNGTGRKKAPEAMPFF